MMRVLLAGSTPELRARLAAELGERLGLPGADGFVVAEVPADLATFDAGLAARGAELDALVHLGGADGSLLDRYGRVVVEVDGTTGDLTERVLERLREALVSGRG